MGDGVGSSMSRTVLLLLFFSTLPAEGYAPVVCNAGTDYACICRNDSIEPRPQGRLPCETFLKASELPAVDMRVRHVNLESEVRTGEKYEHYFKRRIANIVSAFCERHVNECPGTGLRLAPRSPDDSVLYGVEDDEPLLSQENVLLLRVSREPMNVTRLQFNVVRGSALRIAAPLTEDDLVDPVKVKYILGSQEGPLARVLGGIKIDSLRVSRIPRQVRADAGSNTKLHIMLAIVGSFFFICYAVGGYRLYMDSQKRKKKRQTEQSQIVTREDGKKPSNYGAIDAPSTQQNGKPPQQDRVRMEETPFVTVTRPRVLSERQARLMFGCDPSQLPKEMSFDDGLHHAPANTKTVTATARHSGAVPAVVLVKDNSRDSALELAGESVAGEVTEDVHRPKSRRGSRIDETGESIDLTERLPEAVRRAVEAVPTDADAWSSSEGEMDVYYKLSEEDEVKGDVWPARLDDPQRVIVVGGRIRKEVIEDEATSDEETRQADEDEDEIHGYERLREDLSPIPPRTIVVDQDSDHESLR